MITYFLFSTVAALFSFGFTLLDGFFAAFNTVLPQTMINGVALGTGYFTAFLINWWPLKPVWQVFLLYLVVKAGMAVARMVFGARVPDAS